MDINSLKIAYIIGAPFPTIKAYGVTARETLNILMDLSITTKVYCNHGEHFDRDFDPITKLIENFQHGVLDKIFTKLGKISNLKINMISWKIGLLLTILKNFEKIQRFQPNTIWTRDPLVALVFLKKIENINVILEIHDQSGEFFHKKLKKYVKQIHFCPINEQNKIFLKRINPLATSQLAPMGIRQESIGNEKDCDEFISSLEKRKYNNISIGYVGKFSPNGYSKGIEDLINLALYFQEEQICAGVTLLGAETQEQVQYEEVQAQLKIRPNYLKILGQVSHTQALRSMRDFDVLVLPAYKSKEYSGMPIKLLEYLASARIVLIADIPLYKSFFNSDFSPFYYLPDDPKSLNKNIFSALHSENLKEYLLKEIEFCLPYTWQKRTERILDFILK